MERKRGRLVLALATLLLLPGLLFIPSDNAKALQGHQPPGVEVEHELIASPFLGGRGGTGGT